MENTAIGFKNEKVTIPVLLCEDNGLLITKSTEEACREGVKILTDIVLVWNEPK